MTNRICGFYLIVLAAVVAIHTVTEAFYHTFNVAEMYGSIWGVLDWFMALGVLMGLYFGYTYKQAMENGGSQANVTREFVKSNVLFYGFLFVAILFFWNWFIHLSPAAPAPDGGKVLLVWLLVDAGFPLLAGATGAYLLKAGTSDA